MRGRRRRTGHGPRILNVLGLLFLIALPLQAQEPTPSAEPDSVRPRRGSEFLIPAGSIFLPGLGQLIHGAPLAAAAYAGTAVAGYSLATTSDTGGDDLPRRGEEQFSQQAVHTAVTASYLSAWDAFHRAVPALQQSRGRYQFLGERETLGDLITAPFDHRFLSRWTTWLDLAQTAVITGIVLSGRDSGVRYHPFGLNDAAFTTALSMNAAVGEEAFFRGWLLPVLHQNTGERFWLANGIQALIFGAGHLPGAGPFAAYIAGWSAFEGWVVRRNEWSLRESVFHHFWYDVAVVTASLLADEDDAAFVVAFPTIRF